jgi:hypothetical protein
LIASQEIGGGRPGGRYLKSHNGYRFRPPSPLVFSSWFAMTNTLFSGKFSKRKLQSTVINYVWPEVLFFTLVATGEWVLGSSLHGVLS